MENKHALTPLNAFNYLKEGNNRFLNNLKANRDFMQLVNQHTEAQFPFAAILGCSDSRVPVELVFDQGLGDLFVVRLAGNIASDNAIGSLEYTCKYLDSKIIVVLGHSGCGAVKAACDHVVEGNITKLLDQIAPAIANEKQIKTDRNSKNEKFVNKVVHLNVEHQIATILDKSDILRDFYLNSQINIVGAVYNLSSGEVEFMENIAEKYIQKYNLTTAI
ncbi:MAG: carbonic anhydrase [Saprospiraceae bacterium]